MISCLCQNLQQKFGADSLLCGPDSYVRCLAHILNLIVKDILQILKAGNVEDVKGRPCGTETTEEQVGVKSKLL